MLLKLRNDAANNFDNIIFYLDGATIHTSKVNQAFYKQQSIKVLLAKSHTPELNPAEHFIKHHKQRIRATISVQR